MRNAVHLLGGSIALYLLMAARSAGTKGSSSNAGPGSCKTPVANTMNCYATSPIATTDFVAATEQVE